jgi:hypothetical protein
MLIGNNNPVYVILTAPGKDGVMTSTRSTDFSLCPPPDLGANANEVSLTGPGLTLPAAAHQAAANAKINHLVNYIVSYIITLFPYRSAVRPGSTKFPISSTEV